MKLKLSDDCKRGNHRMVQVVTFQNRDGSQTMLETCAHCGATQSVDMTPAVAIEEFCSYPYPMENKLLVDFDVHDPNMPI